MHTSYTLTHTCGHRRISTHTIIHISKHIYTNARKHVSTPTHIPAHKHSCTHICAYYTYIHLCSSVKTYTCIQNKKCIHRHYTQRIYTHRYTHTLTHAHEYASALRISSALRIYRPIHTNIHLCTRIYVCARTSMNNTHQHVRSQTDIQTCMHALNHSRSHIHIRDCVRSVCVCVCVVCACVWVRMIALYYKHVLVYACV